MNHNAASQPLPPKKRKRGKYKNMIVEGDDDAASFVTFEEITTNGPTGPITTQLPVPLVHMPESSHTPAHMVVDSPLDLLQDTCDVNNENGGELIDVRHTKNKVISNIQF
jgi:hypothetical protein